MPVPTHDERKARCAALSDAYRKLEPQEKAALQLLAIVYEPITPVDFVEALKDAKITLEVKGNSGALAFRKLITKLQDQGLAYTERQGGPLLCNELVAEVATRDAVREGQFERFAQAAEVVAPSPLKLSYYFRSLRHGVRLVRLRLYRGEAQELWKTIHVVCEGYRKECTPERLLIRICNWPFDADWFATLPLEIADSALFSIFGDSLRYLTPVDDVLHYLMQAWPDVEQPEIRTSYRGFLAEQYILRGRIGDATALLQEVDVIDVLAKRAWLALLRGDSETALRDYEDTIQRLRVATGKRKGGLWDYHEAMYALALIQNGDAARLKQAHELLKRAARVNESPYRLGVAALLHLVESYLGLPPSRGSNIPIFFPDPQGFAPVSLLLQCLTLHWLESPELKIWLKPLATQHAAAVDAGYHWFAAEMGVLLARVAPDSKTKGTQAETFYRQTGLRPLVDILRRQEAWERSLEALGHIAETERPDAPAVAEFRLAWHLKHNAEYDDTIGLEAREVKRKSSGGWTKGKTVSLKRLATERENLAYLTPQDLDVCTHIVSRVERSDYYGSSRVCYAVQPRAWLALAGHPLVFWQDGSTVEVVKGEPELYVAQKGKHVIVQLVPPLQENQDVCLVRDTPTRLRVIECTPAHRRIAGILHDGLRVPVAQKARVLEALGRVTSLITIHSDIGGGLENVPEVPADARLHVILVPSGDGLRVQIMVRPLAQGAYYRAGAGGETVLAEVDGRRVQTRRRLKVEQEQAAQAIAACPALGLANESDGEWLVDDPECCLELLEQLHDAGEAVVVEWPQGEKMRVAYRASFANLHLKVAGGRDWFKASGKLHCGDDRVFDMRQLLDLLDQTKGRFIPLGEGEFLSLTKEFRKRLDEFRALSEQHGDGARFHPLAAPAVDGLFGEETSIKAAKAWREHLARFRDAQAFDPALPSTLRATLRDYQLEGFQWMARLARWGAGACLADDMGLGKTIQALALMLSHASEGPALVVAPTSVCMNWIAEAQRFAPTLNPILFGAGDRQATLDALKPFDLLVCSYGLLHQEADKLAAVQWRMAVLDEAQAIKNMTTRRSQAAMNLKADFRLITTGTPIENHLGELWNLFRFINPGLLRSLEQFNRQFAIPIEKLQDREARTRLKKTIQPFILRRVKEEVLEELPSRTEIVLHVEFSEEEATFYEALRRKAVDKIAHTDGTAGQKHLRILAEIMRLRRACCNAKLVSPDVAVPSAKLNVFVELVDELIENRHKALVFSQFVDHLSILRKALDARGISYQYLDGSTPQRERKKRVDAFQAGEGDLFLISLKAGGLGLNLTAADYVIHMDPWWNPAAEDQASDRAHRIGQTRPVTIYRLVTEGTIESRIVDLHKHKRDLADSLLEGAEMSGKMSADQLLALLQEGM